MIKINSSITIPHKELHFDFVKGSGAGGQKINKTNSCVVLTWNLLSSSSLSSNQKERASQKLKSRVNNQGEVIVKSQRFRDRGKNVMDCTEKLKELITQAIKVPKKRKPTKIPKASKRARLNNKRKKSEVKTNRKKVDY